MAHLAARHRADEQIREQQQGRGRPIVSFQANDHQIIAVRDRVFWSKTWKTFPDFLSYYVKKVLGSDWGNAEIAKPVAERHPILQWYEAYCRYQLQFVKAPGEIANAEATNVVACYLGLAHSLYLLDHNVELQERLVRRLRNAEQFQGAYYELVVANALIRAGFELTLENEEDGSTKHCEFAAISKRSGKKYWVEAKMRGVAGLLGRTELDGSSSDNPISKMVSHLNGALRKPAADERLIFIDLNTPIPVGYAPNNPPPFLRSAIDRLERYDRKELRAGERAYVFVTCLDFHRDLTGKPGLIVVPFGLGIPDFNRPGVYRLAEMHRRDQAHADALDIGEAFSKLLAFPATFDGSLPSASFERVQRIIIGETCTFPGTQGAPAIAGKVTTACVVEPEKAAYVGVTTADGTSIIKAPLTDRELADYRAHPGGFFGRLQDVGGRSETPYDLFKFFMKAYASLTRSELLNRLKGLNSTELSSKTDDELRAVFCELMVAASPVKFPLSAERATTPAQRR